MMSILRQGLDVEIRCFGVTFGKGQVYHQIVPPSSRDWHQLIYATRGAMTVRAAGSAWLVPPHRGLWLPAGLHYRVEMAGVVALRMLYLRARRRGFVGSLGRSCAVVNVSPLLRELIVRTNLIGALDSQVPEQRRLIGVIYDELKVLTSVPLQLPLPRDQRAASFAEILEAEAAERPPMAKLLRRCGASRRTMERLFRLETGLTLGQWMRRQKLLEALRRLAAGECVNAIALELGYNSPSAFIAMFRRELGQTPKRYFED